MAQEKFPSPFSSESYSSQRKFAFKIKSCVYCGGLDPTDQTTQRLSAENRLKEVGHRPTCPFLTGKTSKH